MSNPGPGAQPVIIYADGSPVSALNPLPTSGGGGGGGTVTQGAGNSDATKGWSSRLTDGSAFIVPAKTGQLPAALGATSAASSLAVGIATDQLSTLATAAKQPALGTAGTPSTDVLSVQGVVGGTPILVSATPSTPAPTFSYITAAATTTVKASAGTLFAVLLTAPFSAGTLSIFDANGTATTPIAGFGANTTQCVLFGPNGLACANGITVVTGAGFNGQVTVVYT